MPGFKGVRAQTTTQAGYGYQHKKARAAAFAKLPEYSRCCRCGKTMWKHAKDNNGRSALHYDHTADRTGYLGFSHKTCNIKAGARSGARAANHRRTRRAWHSRIW